MTSTTSAENNSNTVSPSLSASSAPHQSSSNANAASFNINARAFAPVSHYRSYCFPPGMQEEFNKRNNNTNKHHQPHQTPSQLTPLSFFFEKTLVVAGNNNIIKDSSSSSSQQQQQSSTNNNNNNNASPLGKNQHLSAIQWNLAHLQSESPKICHEFLSIYHNNNNSNNNKSNNNKAFFSDDIPVGYLFSKENWLDGGNISGTNVSQIQVPFKRVIGLPGLVFALPTATTSNSSSSSSNSGAQKDSNNNFLLEKEWKKLLPLLASPTYNFVAFGFFIYRKQPFIFSVSSHHNNASSSSTTTNPINTSPFMEALCTGSRATYCPEGIIPLVIAHNHYRPRAVCIALVSEHEQRLATAPIILNNNNGRPISKNDSPSELIDMVSRSPDHERIVGPTNIRLMQLTATIDDVATSLIASSSSTTAATTSERVVKKEQQEEDTNNKSRIGPSIPAQSRTKPPEQYIVGILPTAPLVTSPNVHNPHDYVRTCIIVEVVIPQLGASAPSSNHNSNNNNNHYNHNNNNQSSNSNSTSTSTSPDAASSSSLSLPSSTSAAHNNNNHNHNHHHSQFSTHYKLQTQPVHEAVRHVLDILGGAACTPTVVFDIRMRQRIPIFENSTNNAVYPRDSIPPGCMDLWSYANGFVPPHVTAFHQQLHFQQQQQQQQQNHQLAPTSTPFSPPTCAVTLRVKDPASMVASAAFGFDWFKIETLQEHVSLWRMISSSSCDSSKSNNMSNDTPPERTLFPPSHRHRLTASRFKECVEKFIPVVNDQEEEQGNNTNHHNEKFLARRYACGPRVFLIVRKYHHHHHQQPTSSTKSNNTNSKNSSSSSSLDFFMTDATMRLATRLPIDSWNLPTTSINENNNNNNTSVDTISVMEASFSSTIRPSQMKIVVHDVVIWENAPVSTTLQYQDRMSLLASHIEHEERYALPSPDPVVIVRCAAVPLAKAVSSLLLMNTPNNNASESDNDHHQFNNNNRCSVDYDFRGLCVFSTDAVKESFEQPLTYVWVPPESASCVFAISEVMTVLRTNSNNSSNDTNKEQENSNSKKTSTTTTTTVVADLLPPGKRHNSNNGDVHYNNNNSVLPGASTRLCRVNLYTAPATPALSRHAPATVAFHNEFAEFYEDEIMSERLVSSDLVVSLLQRSDDSSGAHYWEVIRTLKQAELADVAYSPFSQLGASLRHGVVEGSSGFSHPAMAAYTAKEQHQAAKHQQQHHHNHNNNNPTHHYSSEDDSTSTTATPDNQSDNQLDNNNTSTSSVNDGPVVTPITICSLTPRAEVENAISDPLLTVSELAFTFEAGTYYRCGQCGTIDDRGMKDEDNNDGEYLCSTCVMFKKNKGTCMSCEAEFVDGNSDLRDVQSILASSSAAASADNNKKALLLELYSNARFFCKKCWKLRYEPRPPYTVVAAGEALNWMPTLLSTCLPPSVRGFHDNTTTTTNNSIQTAAGGSASSSAMSSPAGSTNSFVPHSNNNNNSNDQEVFRSHSQKNILRACFKVAKRKQCVDLSTRVRCSVICELFAKKDEPTISFWSENVAQAYAEHTSIKAKNGSAAVADENAASSSLYFNNDVLYMVSGVKNQDEDVIADFCSKFDEQQYQSNFEYRLVPVGEADDDEQEEEEGKNNNSSTNKNKNYGPLSLSSSNNLFWTEEIPLTVDDWKFDFTPKDFGNISAVLSNQPGYLQKIMESKLLSSSATSSTSVETLLQSFFENAAYVLAPNGLISFTIIDPPTTSANKNTNTNTDIVKVTWSAGKQSFTVEPPSSILMTAPNPSSSPTADNNDQEKKQKKKKKTKNSNNSDDNEEDNNNNEHADDDTEDHNDDEEEEEEEDENDNKLSEEQSVVEFMKILNDEKDVESFNDIFYNNNSSNDKHSKKKPSSSSNSFLHITQQQINKALSSGHQKLFSMVSFRNYLDLAKECLGDNMILLTNDDTAAADNNNTSSSSSNNNPSLLYPVVRVSPEAQVLLKNIVVYTFQRVGRDEQYKKSDQEEEARVRREAQEKKKQQKQQQQQSNNNNNSGRHHQQQEKASSSTAAAATPGKYVPPSKRSTK